MFAHAGKQDLVDVYKIDDSFEGKLAVAGILYWMMANRVIKG
jgi:hypothetical protein